MHKLLITTVFPFFFFQSMAQVSDIISVQKKNGSIIKTFFAGSPVVLQTVDDKYLEGTIQYIRSDSIFVIIYDIRTGLSRYGVNMIDTVAQYVTGVHYKDIYRIKVFKYRRFVRGKIDKLLMFGGVGYFGLNLINGVYLGQPVTDKENMQKLGISVAAFSTGWLINRFFPVNRFSRKWHKIVYVKLH